MMNIAAMTTVTTMRTHTIRPTARPAMCMAQTAATLRTTMRTMTM